MLRTIASWSKSRTSGAMPGTSIQSRFDVLNAFTVRMSALSYARCCKGTISASLVPVAAILVAGIRLRFLELVVDPRRYSSPPIQCRVVFRKGQEMGWFEHGSTIIVLAPQGFVLPANVCAGARIRMGESLMRLCAA